MSNATSVSTLLSLPSASERSIDDVIIVASSLLLIGSFFWVPVGAFSFYKKYCTTRKRKIVFFIALFAIVFLPLPENRYVTKLFIWKRFLGYFKGRAIGHISSPHQALYCLVPHGIFPFGVALACVGDLNETAFNDARPIVASSIFYTPVIGHILHLLGAIKASPGAVKRALDRGLSLALSPGGIREMFWGYPRPGCSPNSEYALLKNRFGFVRRAIESGVPLVPVYVFGNSKTFKRVPLPFVFELLSKWLKASLILFWGRWGLPVPFEVPMWFAIGEPINVPRNSNPCDEQIRAVHQKFCKALVDLFDKYKADYGWAHKTLELV